MGGLLDYVGMQYEDPPTSDRGGLSAGQSIGQTLKQFIPGALLAAGLGSVGGDDYNWGDAVKGFATGFLNKRLETGLENRKRKTDQEDFFIKEAYKAVDELRGANLTGIQVPQHIKQSLAELHQKANEALMNDGVISPKEASTLLALAGPIRQALQEEKTRQAGPEFQAQEKERGLLAGFVQQAAQTPGTPLAQAEEDDVLPGRTPEQDAARGAKLYSRFKSSQDVVYEPDLGWIPRKDATRLKETRIREEGRNDRLDKQVLERVKDRVLRNDQFWARLGVFDARQRNMILAQRVAAARQTALQEQVQRLLPAGEAAAAARAEQILNQDLEMIGRQGGLSQAPTRGGQPSDTRRRKTLADGRVIVEVAPGKWLLADQAR